MLRPSLHLLLHFLAAAAGGVAAATPSPVTGNGSTVYELLPKFGLPPGLLPDTVTAFSLAENGAFEVELSAPCYIQFEYLVYYDKKITGVIKYGGIEELKGIEVRRFLVWFDVDEIKVDLPPADYIYFKIGWITKKLSIEQFRTVHSCQKNGIIRRVKGAAKGILKLPEPIREIDMLLTE